MPLPTSSLIQWLKNLGWDSTTETGAPILPGPRIREMPDKVVHVTCTGGPGYLLEADADATTFQARVRGPQNDRDAAETLAFDLDALILGASFPVVTGGRTIIHVHRLAGPPAPLLPSPDDADRTELTCTYLCIAGT